MLNETKKWHVLHVEPKYEKSVSSALRHSGLEVFVPVTKVVKSWSDKKKIVSIPLITGHVLCNISECDKQEILNLEYVKGFVQLEASMDPMIIPKDEIGVLKLLEKGNPEVADKQQYTGEEVMVSEGPFAGFHGIIVENSWSKRLLVKLTNLKHYISVEISSFQLTNAKSSHSLAS